MYLHGLIPEVGMRLISAGMRYQDKAREVTWGNENARSGGRFVYLTSSHKTAG
jgi:hypothetical protein